MKEPTLAHRSVIPTISLTAVGITGLLLNLYSPNLPISENENIFGLIVSTSIAMIGIGFIPSLLKWKKENISKAVMVVTLIVYLLVALKTIITYSET